MLDRATLQQVLEDLHDAVRAVDPEIARAAREDPPERPGDPFVFEYVDRVVVDLSERVACYDEDEPLDTATVTLARTVCHLVVMRTILADAWYVQ